MNYSIYLIKKKIYIYKHTHLCLWLLIRRGSSTDTKGGGGPGVSFAALIENRAKVRCAKCMKRRIPLNTFGTYFSNLRA